MKLLLDHCLPQRLAREFPNHDVRATGEMGWDRLRNGTLLATAAREAFDAFITIDKKMKHEQNLSTLPIAVIVIMSVTNRIADLKPFVPGIEDTLRTLIPRTLVEIVVDRGGSP